MIWSLCLPIGILLSLAVLPVFAQDPVSVPTPYNLKVGTPSNLYSRTDDGEATGIVAETVNEVLHRMGYIPHTFINISSEGMLAAFKTGKINIIAGLKKNTKYKDVGLFSNPIIIDYNLIAVRKGEQFPMLKISDLQGKTIGIRNDNEYKPPPQYTDIELQKFENKGDLLRALVLKKNDAAIISSLADIYDFRTEGVMNHVDILDRSVNFAPVCAVFSKDMFSQQDVDNFNTHLKALQQEPVWAEILSRNGFGDLVHDWKVIGE